MRSPSDSRTGVALLLVQAALSMLLLVGAGLFVQSLRNVRHLRLGYDVDPVLFVHYDLRGVTLDTARTAELHDRLLASAERIPV